jgi:hypothetical protein
MPTPYLSWFIGPNSEWFWALVQSVVVAVSLYFIYQQIRIQSQANMLTALFGLATKWDSDRMIEARQQICTNHNSNTESRSINVPEERIASFFEEIGLFMKKKAFTPDVIWDEYSYYVEHYWPMLEPHVREFRRVERDDSWFENFEALYNQLQQISERRGLYVIKRDDSDVTKFIKGETLLIQEKKTEPRIAIVLSQTPNNSI